MSGADTPPLPFNDEVHTAMLSVMLTVGSPGIYAPAPVGYLGL